ncbi:hypothetical protein MLD38_034361 [Melastoma candidum]|uniref:Uncharacterized protein n=1 Tax=Melastoma candidum TaxID=119954 RepID=A0ACB9MC13_9MYRT|nr:hypothetical protein MLD38_034361 [Melastoma candidum]
MFLFVMHPYSIIDNLTEVDGVPTTVKEMNIPTTVFVRNSDDHKIRYPNSMLSTKPNSNYNCSAAAPPHD